ncbi:phosphotransferase system cellobiose-specific component IIC [Candidatus Scalindua japonica]|uniref:Phosphotransferase system cellobiose-specific component IIC n=1 Tax=Candidatus Scalindua japonica TaxID=1284222 RepID=A0A286U3D8_9BACT|nr:tail fiber domain-containing protein [Candidatus Scalindua japonica]GAX62658.1 phosphotransferase system cellobiose-specific component IIC [Candidatus Scalindua japonica]
MKTDKKHYLLFLMSVAILAAVFALPSGIHAANIVAKLPSNDGNDAFEVQDSGSVSLMDVLSDGKVGIGTATPKEIFQIGDRWTFSDGGWKVMGLNSFWDGVNDVRIENGPSAALAFTSLGDILFRTASSGSTGDLLDGGGFSTWVTPPFIIKNDGKVGIGTSSPSRRFEIFESDTGAHQQILSISSVFGGSVNNFRSIVWRDEFDQTVAGIGSVWDGTSNNIHFHSQYKGGVKSESDVTMSIMGTGKVGIGTTVPSAILSVKDDLSSTSNAMQIDTDGSGTALYVAVEGTGDVLHAFQSTTDNGLTVKNSGNVGIGTASPNQKLTLAGTMSLKEQASANADTAAYGQIWVKTATPNQLWFTDDAGTDVQLGVGGGGGASAINDLSDGITNTTSVFLGSGAGVSDDGTNNNNTALGTGTLNQNTSGSGNTATGFHALNQNITGFQNTATGFMALRYNTTGVQNAANGDLALTSNTTGSNNTANGTLASGNNTEGLNNTAIGSAALNYNQIGNNNVSLGYQAGLGVNGNSQSNNIFLGYRAADNVTTGSNNIVLGYDIDLTTPTSSNTLNIGNLIFGTGIDGTGTTLSSGNVGIGTTSPTDKLTVKGLATFLDSADNNRLAIGFDVEPIIELRDSAGKDRILIDVDDAQGGVFEVLNATEQQLAIMTEGVGGNGVVIVRPASSSAETAGMGGDGVLFVNTGTGTRVAEMFSISSTGNGAINLYSSTGTNGMFLGGDGTASKVNGTSWTVLSDERLKVIHGTFDAGIDEVLKLQPIKFRYKKDNLMNLPENGEHIGFSAQEVQKILPEAVSENAKGFLQIQSDPILWSMLNAIKEQQVQIEQLKMDNEIARRDNTALKAGNNLLREELVSQKERQNALEAMFLVGTGARKKKLVKLNDNKVITK